MNNEKLLKLVHKHVQLGSSAFSRFFNGDIVRGFDLFIFIMLTNQKKIDKLSLSKFLKYRFDIKQTIYANDVLHVNFINKLICINPNKTIKKKRREMLMTVLLNSIVGNNDIEQMSAIIENIKCKDCYNKKITECMCEQITMFKLELISSCIMTKIAYDDQNEIKLRNFLIDNNYLNEDKCVINAIKNTINDIDLLKLNTH